MTNDKTRISSYRRIVPMIYAYQTPGYPKHEGWTKIGEVYKGEANNYKQMKAGDTKSTRGQTPCAIVERHYRVKPIIYTYFKFKMRYLNDSIFDQYPYWIAHYYVDSLEYRGPWKFWQHTDVGRLPGIKGNVDFNIYNSSFYDLRQMTIGSQETIGEKAYSE